MLINDNQRAVVAALVVGFIGAMLYDLVLQPHLAEMQGRVKKKCDCEK